MPWLRLGDTASTHPLFLALLEDDTLDTRDRLATFGFTVLASTLSAQHISDYIVSMGVARSVAWEIAPEMIANAVAAGLFEEVDVDNDRQWRVADDPEFIHMRSREEIEWERQRKSDNSRPDLTIPVRLRDGDACRYCGQVVKFEPGARVGRIVGTYDHRIPQAPATVDTMVVACTACNAGRKNDPLADNRYPILPPPPKPYYSPHTRKWIAEHDWAKANGYSITSRRGKTIPPGTVPDDRKAVVDHTKRTGSQPENATQRPTHQVDNATPADRQPAGERNPATRRPGGHRKPRTVTPRPDTPSDTAQPQRPTTQADNAPPQQPTPPAQTPDLLNTAETAEHLPPGPGMAGTGRDGSGRDGNQRPPTSRDLPSHTRSLPDTSPPRRGRRGKRRQTGT